LKICSLLWRQLYLSEDGSFYPCCLTRGFAEAEFLDEDGKPIKMEQTDALERAWNSPTLKKIRQEMIEGKEPSICGDCFQAEKRGDRSVRIKSNDLYLNSLFTSSVSTVPVSEIRSLDVRWGNICNLKCRMCSPDFSRALLSEHQEIYGRALDPKESHSLLNREWFRSESSVHSLANLENLDTVNFAGGEPLLVKQSTELLCKWVKNGRAKDISLSYNTNLTVLPEETLMLWPYFKDVKIFASIDAFREINSYIRFPSDWQKIEKNLRFLDENFARLGLSYLGIHSTLQIYSVFSFPDMVRWLRGFRNVHPYPDITILRRPEQFEINSMPRELKSLASEGLKTILPISIQNPKDSYFYHSIQAALLFLAEEGNASSWDRFLFVTRFFDSKRGQSVDLIPELAPYFSILQSDQVKQKNSFASREFC
jgi:hypothetical protein